MKNKYFMKAIQISNYAKKGKIVAYTPNDYILLGGFNYMTILPYIWCSVSKALKGGVK